MAENTGSVIRMVVEAFNSRDLDAYAALYADDYELTDTSTGEVFHGPKGAIQNIEPYLIAFPDAWEEVVHMIVRDDWAAIEGFEHGTHSGPLGSADGEIAPTGKAFKMPFCDILRVIDGKIVFRRDHYNWATATEQLGLAT